MGQRQIDAPAKTSQQEGTKAVGYIHCSYCAHNTDFKTSISQNQLILLTIYYFCYNIAQVKHFTQGVNFV